MSFKKHSNNCLKEQLVRTPRTYGRMEELSTLSGYLFIRADSCFTAKEAASVFEMTVSGIFSI